MVHFSDKQLAGIKLIYGDDFEVPEVVEGKILSGFSSPDEDDYYLGATALGVPYVLGIHLLRFLTGDSLHQLTSGYLRDRLIYVDPPKPPAPAEAPRGPVYFTMADISAVIDIYGFFPRPVGYTAVALRPPAYGELYFNPFSGRVSKSLSKLHEDPYLIFVEDAKTPEPVEQKEVPEDAEVPRSGC